MDSGGPGKYRGGTGCCNCFIPWGTDGMGVHTQGLGMETRLASGLIGGYPAPNVKQFIVRDSNIMELLNKGHMPKAIEEVQGNIDIISINSSYDFNKGDVYLVYFGGGGGCGDPLERDPYLVAEDVKSEYVSMAEAERTYGVVISKKDLKPDLEETEKIRKKMIKERLKVGRV